MLLALLGVVGAIGAGVLITAAAMRHSSCGRRSCKHNTRAFWQCAVPQEALSTFFGVLQVLLCPASRYCLVRNSTAHGAILPSRQVLTHKRSWSRSSCLLPTGNVLNSFNPSDGGADIASAVNNICLDFVWLGLACMVASYLEVAAWMTIGAQNLAVCSRTNCETSRLVVCGCVALMLWHRHTHFQPPAPAISALSTSAGGGLVQCTCRLPVDLLLPLDFVRCDYLQYMRDILPKC